MKRVMLCYKEHDKSFIWYYYAYDILKAILDLDPDLVSKFSFLRTFINYAHTDMYDTSNERCVQGLCFFSTPKNFENLWGRYDPKTEKSRHFCL